MARPTEVFHPAELIAEEAIARGWTIWDVAGRMGGDVAVNVLGLQLYALRHIDVVVGDGTDLERAFGIDAAFWLALEGYWRDHPEAHAKMDDQDVAYNAWFEIDDAPRAPEQKESADGE